MLSEKEWSSLKPTVIQVKTIFIKIKISNLSRMEEEGLKQLVYYEESKLMEKKKKKMEKEDRIRETREKAKRNA